MAVFLISIVKSNTLRAFCESDSNLETISTILIETSFFLLESVRLLGENTLQNFKCHVFFEKVYSISLRVSIMHVLKFFAVLNKGTYSYTLI